MVGGGTQGRVGYLTLEIRSGFSLPSPETGAAFLTRCPSTPRSF